MKQAYLTMAVVTLLLALGNLAAKDWPRWRGPDGSGMGAGPAAEEGCVEDERGRRPGELKKGNALVQQTRAQIDKEECVWTANHLQQY